MEIRNEVDHACVLDRCRDKGTYTVDSACRNCGWSGIVRLTKEHEFSPRSIGCPGCGCLTLMRRTIDRGTVRVQGAAP